MKKPYYSDSNYQCLRYYTSCDQNCQKVAKISSIITSKPSFHKLKTGVRPPPPLIMTIGYFIPDIQK